MDYMGSVTKADFPGDGCVNKTYLHAGLLGRGHAGSLNSYPL